MTSPEIFLVVKYGIYGIKMVSAVITVGLILALQRTAFHGIRKRLRMTWKRSPAVGGDFKFFTVSWQKKARREAM